MERFSLKWNDFQKNVSSSFSKLKTEKDFCDVTLVSDDEVHISSHKVVLLASSEFFKNILRKSPHTNPLIYLSGVKSKELNFVMDYIYDGEVQIYQEDLDSFLDIAEKLKIDGLVAGIQPTGKQENKNSNDIQNDPYVKDEVQQYYAVEEVQSYTPEGNQLKPRRQPIQSFALSTLNIDVKEATDQLVIKNADNFECKSCGKTARTSSDIRRHVEVHIEGLSFECQTCGNTFRSRNHLKTHVSRKHSK